MSIDLRVSHCQSEIQWPCCKWPKQEVSRSILNAEGRMHPPEPTPLSRCEKLVPQWLPEWFEKSFNIGWTPFWILSLNPLLILHINKTKTTIKCQTSWKKNKKSITDYNNKISKRDETENKFLFISFQIL